jgi:hypothetical protein
MKKATTKFEKAIEKAWKDKKNSLNLKDYASFRIGFYSCLYFFEDESCKLFKQIKKK